MDLTDTKKIMAYVSAAFPKYYANVTKDSVNRQAIVWQEVLGEYSTAEVKAGAMSYIASDSSGFPPTPGQIIEHIHFVGKPQDHSGTQAWALVRKAVNVPWDQFEASFATLPRAVQIAVGSPESLKELAQMDTQRFETVAQSNFLRMYDAAQRREAKEEKIPNAVIAARDRLALELQSRREARQPALPMTDQKKELIEDVSVNPSAEMVIAPAEMIELLRSRLGGSYGNKEG